MLADQAGIPADIWTAFQRPCGEPRIRTVLAVMQHPTFNSAARHLGLRASVISVQVAGLEKDLGISLINRTVGTRKMTLTSEGLEFAEQARRILTQLDQIRSRESSTATASRR